MKQDVTPRLLVVEDDSAVRDALTGALVAEGYTVRACADGLFPDSLVAEFAPDLAVLDVRLGHGPSGLAVARRLRADRDLPIIFLTAADAVEDRLAGFDAGAEDYVTKPFAMAELLARVRALLRRSGRLDSGSWTVADLTVDEAARRAHRGDADLILTKVEFDLLSALGRSAGRVLSKGQLLADVWGFEDYDPNVVEVAMSGLRRKLEANGPRLVHTVRGVGYVLRP
ncbi:response regulator transcription factor [Pseudonocardia broussonetiae]|uniref:Response regulator transcription factor n=1 Tax=Pseudonocardia broussonetiae TaxID=2736640 RepID=A0A6M6JRK4_9PSEU|nr:response regulator transcription factor [Pseudonocardia broussonetiae]QJY49039.1 response regulator transcription factor [Pseudonocardia broussonetiae]